MKRTIAIIIIAIITVSAVSAKTPKWVKSNTGAVCQVITYDDKGNEAGRATGFFTGSDGSGMTTYDIFVNASRAEAIDSKGISHDILYVIGANRIYDIIRFKIEPDPKLQTVSLAQESASDGETLYLLPYSTNKKVTPVEFSVISGSSMADNYTYYALHGNVRKEAAGCPLFNAAGQLVGIIQNAIESDTCNYAIDSRYAASLSISSALVLNDDNYRSMTFPKALPDTEEQALVYLFMNQAGRSDAYGELIDRFIAQYPDSPDGFLRKGSYLVLGEDTTLYAEGIACFDKAVEMSDPKDNALYEYANNIYISFEADTHPTQKGWSLLSALRKVSKALEINNIPAYLQLQGNIQYALKHYDSALKCYQELNRTNLASPETHYYTAVIKGNLRYSSDQIIASLDSAVNFYGRPYTTKVAPFILERAGTKEEAGRYREAVADLNEYEQIIGASGLTAEFYYFREQIEVNAKMYEQALTDIRRAIEMSPDDMGLSLEAASLMLRLGLAEEALTITGKLVAAYPDDTDCLRLYGISLLRSENKTEAIKHLEKAKELGDKLAGELLDTL